MNDGIYIDANLILLLTVGLTRPQLISKHKRTKEYSISDYELLLEFLNRFKIVLVTPNTLTEASNLLRQHGDPEKSEILSTFRALVKTSEESSIVSSEAVDHVKFPSLGLIDVVLLSEASPNTPLITVDLALYLATVSKNPSSAINFNHMRDLSSTL